EYQAEAAAQVEVPHIGLEQLQAPVDQLRLGKTPLPPLEHARRRVDAHDVVSAPGKRYGDPPAARAELKDGPVDGLRQVVVEVDVFGELGVREVVDVGDRGVGVRHQGNK